ncbi:hypothetical protein WJX72_005472 [[Myrmecia] bisecta]|uniref:Uncharacterized protein n=1 Tax=[Myrmecia] bisecta TaxID=41462 RepID=A0AAW1QQR1_9CHLO
MLPVAPASVFTGRQQHLSASAALQGYHRYHQNVPDDRKHLKIWPTAMPKGPGLAALVISFGKLLGSLV